MNTMRRQGGQGTPAFAGRYELGERLGTGASSEVYRAFDRHLGRDVALKLFTVRQPLDAILLARFGRAMEAAVALDDPHVAAVFDYGVDGSVAPGGRFGQGPAGLPGPSHSLPYLAVELVPGGTLETALRQRQRLSTPEALTIALQIASALEVAHRQGTVHGALHARNVLLDARGAVRVTDFGLAGVFAPARRHGPADTGGDLQAMGTLLQELLAGQSPARAGLRGAARPGPVPRGRPDSGGAAGGQPPRPPSTSTALATFLAADTATRYGSAAELRDALAQALAGEPSTRPLRAPAPPSLSSRPPSRTLSTRPALTRSPMAYPFRPGTPERASTPAPVSLRASVSSPATPERLHVPLEEAVTPPPEIVAPPPERRTPPPEIIAPPPERRTPPPEVAIPLARGRPVQVAPVRRTEDVGSSRAHAVPQGPPAAPPEVAPSPPAVATGWLAGVGLAPLAAPALAGPPTPAPAPATAPRAVSAAARPHSRRRGAYIRLATVGLLAGTSLLGTLAIATRSVWTPMRERAAPAIGEPSPPPVAPAASATPVTVPLAGPPSAAPGPAAPPLTPAPTASPVPAPPPLTPAPTASPEPAVVLVVAPTEPPSPPDPVSVLPDVAGSPILAPAPLPAVPNTSDPVQAVISFYGLAGAGQFEGAAGLWTPHMAAAYPPRENIAGRFGQTQRIVVQRAEAVAVNPGTGRATVAVELLEVVGTPPINRRYVGTWQLVRSGNGWLLDQPNLVPR